MVGHLRGRTYDPEIKQKWKSETLIQCGPEEETKGEQIDDK